MFDDVEVVVAQYFVLKRIIFVPGNALNTRVSSSRK